MRCGIRRWMRFSCLALERKLFVTKVYVADSFFQSCQCVLQGLRFQLAFPIGKNLLFLWQPQFFQAGFYSSLFALEVC